MFRFYVMFFLGNVSLVLTGAKGSIFISLCILATYVSLS
jgi:hypothetical protein